MNGKFWRIMIDDVMKVSFVTSHRAVEQIHTRESAMIVSSVLVAARLGQSTVAISIVLNSIHCMEIGDQNSVGV